VTHTLFIPGWHPTSLNKLIGMHWRDRADAKVTDYTVVAYQCREGRVTEAVGKRRVSALFVFGKGKRRTDPDSFHKVLLDALVRCKVLKNDSQVWCELGAWECVRAADGEEWGTRVVLEDIS
jgi:hypothetical protein